MGERVLGRINGQRFATGAQRNGPASALRTSILIDRIRYRPQVARRQRALHSAERSMPNWCRRSSPTTLLPSSTAAWRASIAASMTAMRWVYPGRTGERATALGLIASREQGHDYRFPGGTADGTAFERNLYGVHAGFPCRRGRTLVEYRRSETDPSGNPPFALDMTISIPTSGCAGRPSGQIAEDVGLTVRLGHVAVRHLMDNQTLRQLPLHPHKPGRLCRC